jgi:hypothetical protein
MLAEATNLQIGDWVVAGFAVINGLGALGALVAFFATRREVQEIDRRVIVMETAMVDVRAAMAKDKVDLISNGEDRSSRLHRRIDPLIENTAALKASHEAFTESFKNFTNILVQQKKS